MIQPESVSDAATFPEGIPSVLSHAPIECAPQVNPAEGASHARELIGAVKRRLGLVSEVRASIKVTNEKKRLIASGQGGCEHGLPKPKLGGSVELRR
jgi:hypothetical protein